MSKSSNLKKMLQVIDFNYSEGLNQQSEQLLRFLLENDKYLENWITAHTLVQEGKTYTIPDSSLYKAIAVLRLIVQHSIAGGALSEKTIAVANYILPFLKEAHEKIRMQPELFLDISKANSIDINQLIKFWIQSIEDANKTYKHQELINEPVSQLKIDEFKDMIYKQWDETRTLAKVFEFFNAVDYNPNEQLQWVGLHKIQFKGARIMFVEKNYQKIYGIEWGRQVNDEITRFFLKKISETESIVQLQKGNYLETFDEIVQFHPQINIAFVSPSTSVLISRPLLESGHFTDYTIRPISNFTFPTLGIYKEKLIIVPLGNRAMSDGVIALKMPGAVLKKQKTDNTWIDEKLQLDIQEINDENVKQVIQERYPGADLSDPKMLEEVKTGILIELDELIDFEIKEPENIVVAAINERID